MLTFQNLDRFSVELSRKYSILWKKQSILITLNPEILEITYSKNS